MFPTNADLEFYRSKQVLPSWVQKIEKRTLPASIIAAAPIDIVVNAHASVRPSNGEIAVGNLLSIVRSYRRRGLNLARELRQITVNPDCAINPEKRAAFARKWALRLEERR